MKQRYRKDGDHFVPGIALPVIIDNVSFHLAEIVVYKDGVIDCWGHMELAEFETKLNSGWVKTSIPDGSELYAFPLGAMKIEKFIARRSASELLQEVKDVLAKLNDLPDSTQSCQQAFNSYVTRPSEESKRALRQAYDAVPRHNRQFILGDMDVDDLPIRVALFGMDELRASQKGMVFRDLILRHYLKGIV